MVSVLFVLKNVGLWCQVMWGISSNTTNISAVMYIRYTIYFITLELMYRYYYLLTK